MTAATSAKPSSKIKPAITWSIVCLSLLWTAINWSGLSKVMHRLKAVAFFAIAIGATEIMFCVGAVLVVVAVAKQSVFNWELLRHIKETYRDYAQVLEGSSLFRFGFILNWVGAFGTGAFGFAGILVVLPWTAWGLLVLPTLDIVATFAWRVPLHRALKRA